MKILLFFIIIYIVVKVVKRLLITKRISVQKPPIRTVTEASLEQQPITHKEKNKQ